MIPLPPMPSGAAGPGDYPVGSTGAGATVTGGFGPIEGVVTPAGWYPDPWQWWGHRWWDGAKWSSYTYEPPIVEVPVPPPPLPTFPLSAGIIGIAILAASLLVTKFFLPIAFAWMPVALYVAFSMAVAYLPSFFWCLVASRRYGSGRVLHDLGVEVKPGDLGWGPLTWFAILIGNVVLMLLITWLGIPFTSNVGGGRGLAGRDRSLFLLFAITAVAAAPFFEELLFRGLVMRSFRSTFPFPLALILQGIAFGLAHFDPSFGQGNIGLLIVLSWGGIGFGFAAHKLRRNGVSMVAHAIMNGVVVLSLLATSNY